MEQNLHPKPNKESPTPYIAHKYVVYYLEFFMKAEGVKMSAKKISSWASDVVTHFFRYDFEFRKNPMFLFVLSYYVYCRFLERTLPHGETDRFPLWFEQYKDRVVKTLLLPSRNHPEYKLIQDFFNSGKSGFPSAIDQLIAWSTAWHITHLEKTKEVIDPEELKIRIHYQVLHAMRYHVKFCRAQSNFNAFLETTEGIGRIDYHNPFFCQLLDVKEELENYNPPKINQTVPIVKPLIVDEVRLSKSVSFIKDPFDPNNWTRKRKIEHVATPISEQNTLAPPLRDTVPVTPSTVIQKQLPMIIEAAYSSVGIQGHSPTNVIQVQSSATTLASLKSSVAAEQAQLSKESSVSTSRPLYRPTESAVPNRNITHSESATPDKTANKTPDFEGTTQGSALTVMTHLCPPSMLPLITSSVGSTERRHIDIEHQIAQLAKLPKINFKADLPIFAKRTLPIDDTKLSPFERLITDISTQIMAHCFSYDESSFHKLMQCSSKCLSMVVGFHLENPMLQVWQPKLCKLIQRLIIQFDITHTHSLKIFHWSNAYIGLLSSLVRVNRSRFVERCLKLASQASILVFEYVHMLTLADYLPWLVTLSPNMSGVRFSSVFEEPIYKRSTQPYKLASQNLEEAIEKHLASVQFLGIDNGWVPEVMLRKPPSNLLYLSVENVLNPPISTWNWNALSKLQFLRITIRRGLERRGDQDKVLNAYMKVPSTSQDNSVCPANLLSFIARHCTSLRGLQISIHESWWRRNDPIYMTSLWSGECPFKQLEYLHLIGSFVDIAMAYRCKLRFPATLKALALTDISITKRECSDACDHMSTLVAESTTIHIGTADVVKLDRRSSELHSAQQMLSVSMTPNFYGSTTRPPRLHPIRSFTRRFSTIACNSVLKWPISAANADTYNCIDADDFVFDTVIRKVDQKQTAKHLPLCRVLGIGPGRKRRLITPVSDTLRWPRSRSLQELTFPSTPTNSVIESIDSPFITKSLTTDFIYL